MSEIKRVVYTEKDITLPTRGRKVENEVKLKGKIIGYWHVWFECYFTPHVSTSLESFDAKSVHSLKKQLLDQLNHTSNENSKSPS